MKPTYEQQRERARTYLRNMDKLEKEFAAKHAQRISDGHGCVTRATIADRDLTAEYLDDHREAMRAGWE